jgi:hypothetical protein
MSVRLQRVPNVNSNPHGIVIWNQFPVMDFPHLFCFVVFVRPRFCGIWSCGVLNMGFLLWNIHIYKIQMNWNCFVSKTSVKLWNISPEMTGFKLLTWAVVSCGIMLADIDNFVNDFETFTSFSLFFSSFHPLFLHFLLSIYSYSFRFIYWFMKFLTLSTIKPRGLAYRPCSVLVLCLEVIALNLRRDTAYPDCCLLLLVSFPCLKKNKSRLMRSRRCLCACVCLCIPLSLLGNTSVRTPLSFARRRLGRNVTAVTNTHSTIEEIFDASFSMWPMS